MKKLFCLTGLLILAICAACTLPESITRQKANFIPDYFPDKGPLLTIFLQVKDKEGPAVWAQIAAMEIFDGTRWIPLLITPIEIDSKTIGAGQQFLSNRQIPAAQYSKMRIFFDKAAIHYQGKMFFLYLEKTSTEILLPEKFKLDPQDSETLLLSWDTDKSLPGTASFDPHILAVSPLNIRNDLLYAVCPDINSIFFVRTDTNHVVGSLGMSGRPSHLFTDRDNDRFYVLLGKEKTIAAFELSSNKLIDKIALLQTAHPDFMASSKDKKYAYIFDQDDLYLMRYNLTAGTLDRVVQLNDKPVYLTVIPDTNQLAIATSISRDILILDGESLSVVKTITVDDTPEGMVYHDKKLFVAEKNTNSIKVYDFEKNRIIKSINVGFAPARLILADDTVYISNSGGSTLSLLSPDFLTVTRTVEVGDYPGELAFAQGQKWLYVANQGVRGLAIVNVTSGLLAAPVELGAVPSALDILE